MPKARYLLLALLPAVAAWLYFVGQSAGSIVALFDAAAARDRPAARLEAPRPEVPGAAATRDASLAARGAAATPPGATAASVVAAPATQPAPAVSPTLPPAKYADVLDAAEAPIEHPEITDPRIRALLQPAWDD